MENCQNASLLANITADAFADDPMMQFIWTGNYDADKMAALPGLVPMFRMLAQKMYVPKGFCQVTDCKGGATMWLPPGVNKQVNILESLDLGASMIKHGGVAALHRGMHVDDAMAKLKPKQDALYLFTIGTMIKSRGQGLGGALLREGCEKADQENLPIYLENSKEQNIGFYQHFGFEIIDEVQPIKGAPTMWLMWRHAIK